jgi:transposase-like protein
MSQTGKTRRRLSAEEKLRIFEDARQPQTTVAEVLRRHQLERRLFDRHAG